MMSDVAGAADEVPLTGGSTPGVVRWVTPCGRPLNPGSAWVHRLIRYPEDRGFDGAPWFFGIDDAAREILSFSDGFAPPHNGVPLTEEGQQSVPAAARGA